jgi:hypothetical protein
MKELTFSYYAAGVLLFFVIREYIMDGIYTNQYGPGGERFRYSLFFLFFQIVINILFALASHLIYLLSCCMKHEKETKPKPALPLTRLFVAYLTPGLTQAIANYLGNKVLFVSEGVRLYSHA